MDLAGDPPDDELSWPGNVRELENAVEHAIICAQDNVIRPECLPQEVRVYDTAQNETPERMPLQQPEEKRQLASSEITEALQQAGGNKTLAAKYLGVDRTTLWRRMRRLKISDTEIRTPAPSFG
ncbi:MAG: helix-turn-helix domain-containing protein [Hyphomicrobiales bacterium]